MTIALTANTIRDYRLTGPGAASAIQRGLAEADWYLSPVPRATMQQLLTRRDGPAIRDTLLWFSLLLLSGWLGWQWWGTWWAVIPFAVYGVLYASSADARWHETSHGTAFRTDWMNAVLYEIASFMMQRDSIPWKWSHNRHHSDTMVVGRDPEFQVPRPTKIIEVLAKFIAFRGQIRYFRRLRLHATGRLDQDETAYVPADALPAIIWRARISIAMYLTVIAAAVAMGSLLPLMYIGLPTLYGSWLSPIFALTQHAGLPENVLDHRLNSRTVLMNPVLRFLYWNMNYHIEHHMYPLVPYHALPRLHQVLKDDLPPPCKSLWAAFREIIPALWRQRTDPDWAILRTLSRRAQAGEELRPTGEPNADGWVDALAAIDLPLGQARRVNHGRRTFAVYRTQSGALHATDGICTHGNRHLGDGLVIGDHIECPKHNGRFHLASGAPSRPPVCRALCTYPIEERSGRIWFRPGAPGGAGARTPEVMQFRVISNRNVATFIKELVLEPVTGTSVTFTPGDYLQLSIPAFDKLAFSNLDIDPAFSETWQPLRHLQVANPTEGRRNNYSIASIPSDGNRLRFNVRIALPPAGSHHPPGIGSAWVFARCPGDIVEAIGPYGDFHIRPTLREMVYLGGGAGMAPIRAHLGALLDGPTPSPRRISFWYGGRSRRELFGTEELTAWADRHANFRLEIALSEPRPEDSWAGETGFIHEVLLRRYLASHQNPSSIEYYLCGPPPMITAGTEMLRRLGVPEDHIAYDAF